MSFRHALLSSRTAARPSTPDAPGAATSANNDLALEADMALISNMPDRFIRKRLPADMGNSPKPKGRSDNNSQPFFGSLHAGG